MAQCDGDDGGKWDGLSHCAATKEQRTSQADSSSVHISSTRTLPSDLRRQLRAVRRAHVMPRGIRTAGCGTRAGGPCARHSRAAGRLVSSERPGGGIALRSKPAANTNETNSFHPCANINMHCVVGEYHVLSGEYQSRFVFKMEKTQKSRI